MVNIVTNDQSSSVTLNIDSGEISPQISLQNSLVRLADDVGITDTIDDINQESYQTDQELREEYDLPNQHYGNDDEEEYYEQDEQDEQDEFIPEDNEYEKSKTRKRPKKKKSSGENLVPQKRIDEVTYKLIEKGREYEDLERQLKKERDEKVEIQLLLEKQRISHDLDRVSNVIIKATENGQTQTITDANRLMYNLTAQDNETDQALNHLRSSYQAEPEVTEEDRLAEENYIRLSDPKELNSYAHINWLTRNPIFNSFDPDHFDAEIAEDAYNIKKNFNKFLKVNKNADFIATDEYYDELDKILKNKLFGDYRPQQAYSNQGYEKSGKSTRNQYYTGDEDMAEYRIPIDQNYEQNYGQGVPEGQSRNMSGQYPDDPKYKQQYQQPQQPQRNGPMPVNRSGYNQNYSGPQMPELNADQMRMVRSMPMFDTKGRQLSEREKIHEYQQGLMSMMPKGRR